MVNLYFKAEDVRRVCEHSIAAPEQRQKLVDFSAEGDGVYEPVPEPAVCLVHDQGVYLMSNGLPGDPVDPAKPDGLRFCAYAQGCNPHTDADWWETSRELVGGDDFGETFPWAKDLLALINEGPTHIVVSIGVKYVSYAGATKRTKGGSNGKS